MTVNYRAEPLAERVLDPNAPADAFGGRAQTAGEAGDLASAFVSGHLVETGSEACNGAGVCKTDVSPIDPATGQADNLQRAVPALNLPPTQWPYLSLGDTPARDFARGPLQSGALTGDPSTPLLRAYEGDRVQIRMLVGAHEEGHNFSVHGMKWLFELGWLDSGFRNSQMSGISEHFEFDLAPLKDVTLNLPFEDYLYATGSAVDDLWNGSWGLIRAYMGPEFTTALATSPSNPDGKVAPFINEGAFKGPCPITAPLRKFNIVALPAADVLGADGLVFNGSSANGGPLTAPDAILYVQKGDLKKGKGALKDRYVAFKPGIKPEPLILRAAAGDCIAVTLDASQIPTTVPKHNGFNTLPMIVANFNSNELAPSKQMGLHPQLLDYDIGSGDGMNVGWNPKQTIGPGEQRAPESALDPEQPDVGKFRWYAGQVSVCVGGGPVPQCNQQADGWRVAIPMEFGAVSLMPADPIKHSEHGAVGSLVVEPEGATWLDDGFSAGKDGVGGTPDDKCTSSTVNSCSHASATVTLSDGLTRFRDFVLVYEDDLNMRCKGCGIAPGTPGAGPAADADAIPNLAEAEDPEDSGQKAFNYKTEPLWLRMGFKPSTPLTETRNLDFTDVLSSALHGDPETPIFTADPSTPVRFRVVHPGGHARNHVFQVHGHIWQQIPWVKDSTEIGDNQTADGRWISEFKGAQEGIGPSSHFNFVLQNGAGGKAGVSGDYLFRDQPSFQFDGGLWGILRVCGGGNAGHCVQPL